MKGRIKVVSVTQRYTFPVGTVTEPVCCRESTPGFLIFFLEEKSRKRSRQESQGYDKEKHGCPH